jgi:cytochrome P450
MDPSKHSRHRTMIEQGFSKENIQLWRGNIEQICNQLIDQMKNVNQSIDLHILDSLPVSRLVIYHILGIP